MFGIDPSLRRYEKLCKFKARLVYISNPSQPELHSESNLDTLNNKWSAYIECSVLIKNNKQKPKHM